MTFGNTDESATDDELIAKSIIDKDTRLPTAFIKVLAGELDSMLLFNKALLTLHREKKTNIADAVIYLTTDYVETTELMKILQTNVLAILQAELAQKHNIYQVTNKKLSKFMH